MALITKNPTANQSPDATLGGSAVVSPTNTGHAATNAIISGIDSQLFSCRWFSVQDVGGQRKSVTLKVTHLSSGSVSGTGTNRFTLSYSTNGGSAWTDIVDRVNYTTTQGPTVASVTLAVGQDLTQVQVRDLISATGIDAGDTANAEVTISDIKVEVVTVDQGVITMM